MNRRVRAGAAALCASAARWLPVPEGPTLRELRDAEFVERINDAFEHAMFYGDGTVPVIEWKTGRVVGWTRP